VIAVAQNEQSHPEQGLPYEALLHQSLFRAASGLIEQGQPSEITERIALQLLDVALSGTVEELVVRALALLADLGTADVRFEQVESGARRMLEHPRWRVRVQLADWLVLQDSAAAVPWLERLAQEEDQDIAGLAEVALASFMPDQARLRSHLQRREEMSAPWRETAEARLRAATVSASLQEALLALLAGAELELQFQIAALLLESEKAHSARNVLLELLNGEEPEVRSKAAELLAGTARETLLPLLNSGDPALRLLLGRLLLGSEYVAAARHVLAELLSQENPWIRLQAAQLLQDTEHRTTVHDVFLALLRGKDPWLQLQAAQRLWDTEWRTAAREALESLVTHTNPWVRLRSAQLLQGTTHGVEAVLVAFLTSEDTGLRVQAAQLLLETEHADVALETLMQLLACGDLALQLRAARVLRGTAGEAAAQETLVALLEGKVPWTRHEASRQLQDMDLGDATLDALTALLAYPDPWLHFEAAKLLHRTERQDVTYNALLGLLVSDDPELGYRASRLLQDTEPGTARPLLARFELWLKEQLAWPPEHAGVGHPAHLAAWTYAVIAVRE
jgi:HEAT repeat protein